MHENSTSDQLTRCIQDVCENVNVNMNKNSNFTLHLKIT